MALTEVSSQVLPRPVDNIGTPDDAEVAEKALERNLSNGPPELLAKYELQRMETSGSAKGNWTSGAWRALEAWKAAAKSPIELSEFRCFQAGCSASALFNDMGAFNESAHGPDALAGVDSWPGRKFRSGPIPTSGRNVKVTWILYHPTEITTHQGDER